ncbi:MAG: DUF3592 domain-containing protein [Lysobacteraceae bacterium]
MLFKLSLCAFLLIGLALATFGVYFIAEGYEAKRWPQTTGTIVSVAVRTDTAGYNKGVTRAQRERSYRYYPSILYRWNVDGRTYTGSRYRLGTTHEKYGAREEAVAAASAYRNGAAIDVFYDPANPDQAVLVNAPSGGVFVPLPLGLLIAAIGGFGLWRFDLIAKAVAAG